ncbi:DUF2935 family protein [Alkalibaculum bacchi]|uniref:DUF2935 family protein n=1 Tax=Alkalibaculum bacchi TaxID=645887 RepID=A0A366I1V9_9FIRM|nr:DUF2935 domain-containing protein [Alkalibaculum bacchi]RBP61360.1 DUF2935 family protein [Alkalibaculum bacchi]
MRFCYGNKNGIRILEEAEFWKRQEAEHTVVIQEIVPDLEDEYKNTLNTFKKEFESTEGVIVQMIEYAINIRGPIPPNVESDIRQLIAFTINQSQAFVSYLTRMIEESTAVANYPASVVVINHIIRESQYYIGIAKAYLSL